MRAGVDRVLDQLLDDRGRPLDHFAGRDLVRQLGRQTVDAVHSQSLRRKNQSMTPDDRHHDPEDPPELRAVAARTDAAASTFMPYRLVSTVSGMKIVAMTVSTFITWFRRFDCVDR